MSSSIVHCSVIRVSISCLSCHSPYCALPLGNFNTHKLILFFLPSHRNNITYRPPKWPSSPCRPRKRNRTTCRWWPTSRSTLPLRWVTAVDGIAVWVFFFFLRVYLPALANIINGGFLPPPLSRLYWLLLRFRVFLLPLYRYLLCVVFPFRRHHDRRTCYFFFFFNINQNHGYWIACNIVSSRFAIIIFSFWFWNGRVRATNNNNNNDDDVLTAIANLRSTCHVRLPVPVTIYRSSTL